MNAWFSNPPSIWSFVGLIGGIVFCAIMFVYLWFCYYPGGYKKQEVMDIGEYAMFVAQVKVEERKKQVEKTEEDEYVNQYDELYYEMTPRSESTRDDRSKSDWQSERRSDVGSEQYTDIEGSRDYYDGTSQSSPGRSSSAGHSFHDGQSTMTPRTDGATPGTEGVTPRTDGVTPRTDGATPRTEGVTPRTDSATPSEGVTPLQGGASRPYSRDDRSESTYTSGFQSYY